MIAHDVTPGTLRPQVAMILEDVCSNLPTFVGNVGGGMSHRTARPLQSEVTISDSLLLPVFGQQSCTYTSEPSVEDCDLAQMPTFVPGASFDVVPCPGVKCPELEACKVSDASAALKRWDVLLQPDIDIGKVEAELQQLEAAFLDSSPSFLSTLRSLAHSTGTCKPCLFFNLHRVGLHSKGCRKQPTCEHCHEDHSDQHFVRKSVSGATRRRRQKERQQTESAEISPLDGLMIPVGDSDIDDE
mmetsp:Transcript_62693/g.112870  ORF Transcript_62693/g.112870 Transcript_62693/m.112870 type:complete len:243 (+) Transcript_62693:37-765(+)